MEGLLLNNTKHFSQEVTVGTLLERVRTRKQDLSKPIPFLHRVLSCPNSGIYSFEIGDEIFGRTANKIGNGFHQIRYEYLAPGSEVPTLVHDLDVPVDDLIFWEAGDLQVLSEERDHGTIRRIHFRTFSSNQPHPLAMFPFIDLHRDDYDAWNKYSLRLYQDRFAIVLTENRLHRAEDKGGVIVWSWTEGRALLSYTRALDAVFVSRDVLVCLIWTGAQLILLLKSLSIGETTHTLMLPTPFDFHWAQFNPQPSCHSIIGLNGCNWEGMQCKNRPVSPFSLDPEVDLILMEFRLKGTPIARQGRLLVISTQGLLNIFNARLAKKAAAAGYTDMPSDWDYWSESVATWLPWGMEKVSMRTSFGSKVLVLAPISPESSWKTDNGDMKREHLILLDFNPRVQTSQADDDYRDALLNEIDRWTSPLYETYSQNPGLKYKVRLWEQNHRYKDLCLHGDGFVGRKADGYDLFSFSSPAMDGITTTNTADL